MNDQDLPRGIALIGSGGVSNSIREALLIGNLEFIEISANEFEDLERMKKLDDEMLAKFKESEMRENATFEKAVILVYGGEPKLSMMDGGYLLIDSLEKLCTDSIMSSKEDLLERFTEMGEIYYEPIIRRDKSMKKENDRHHFKVDTSQRHPKQKKHYSRRSFRGR